MVTTNQQYSPQKKSDDILQCVRSSNLHFSIQETPFSVYITLRKKFIRGSLEVESNEGHVEDEILKAELSEVKKKCEDLIQIKEELNYDVEQKDNEYNHLEIFTNELSFKLEKAKLEVSEYLAKCN